MNFIDPILDEDFVDSLTQEKKPHHWPTIWDIDNKTEILDLEEGMVYKKYKNGKKGPALRKFFQPMESSYSSQYQNYIWHGKLKDLLYCEAKRWKAQLHFQKQMKVFENTHETVFNAGSFCCARCNEDTPNFKWAVFHNHKDDYRRGVSWDYQNERPQDVPMKQNIGDLWFEYEARSKVLYRRKYMFDRLFNLAIEKRYGDIYSYSADEWASAPNRILSINGRTYITGYLNTHGHQTRFGIVSYPENLITEIIE